jgi:hypothetical protein
VAEVRASMAGIVSALAIALPAAEDADRFGDPALRDELTAALAELRRNAAALATHGSCCASSPTIAWAATSACPTSPPIRPASRSRARPRGCRRSRACAC